MLLEMGLIVAGIPAGWLLRRNDKAKALVGRALTWAVWALLFMLGLALGSDSALLEQISRLGARAAVISTLSVAGCLVFARLLGRWLNMDTASRPEATGTSAASAETGERSGGGMKGSLLVLGFFFAGVLIGWLDWLPRVVAESDASLWILYVLLFCAGMGVGFDLNALGIIRELKGRILLVPAGVVAGTLAGSTLAWALLGLFGAGLPLPDSLAVGAGFGYYSLATVIITQLGDPALGSVALLSNMIHEIITLTLSPLLVRVVGRLGPVMAGGAAAMDTCLPIIARYSGERYAILAVFSGMTLTLLVPVLVPALMSFR